MSEQEGAWERAQMLGAVDEAERLGSVVVGTEHLLLATLADPIVRWAIHLVGVELHDVHEEIARVMSRNRARRGSDRITGPAADAVLQACADSALLATDELGSADVGRVLQALACRFLVRTRQDEARDVLDRLGVIRRRTQVLATIEGNTRQARLPQPVDTPPRKGADAGTSVAARRLLKASMPSPDTGA